MNKNSDETKQSRREAIKTFFRFVFIFLFGWMFTRLLKRKTEGATVWQIDPYKCRQCGRCAANCVVKPSAVKCYHSFKMCGRCELCSGFFDTGSIALTEGAENQLCPTGAIKRIYLEEPYYEYEINKSLCIGCGKCVKGCDDFGNGSLYLQVMHDLCVNCNKCSIQHACPQNALVRVPAASPYLLKRTD